MTTQQKKADSGFAYQAARYSVGAPLIAILLGFCGNIALRDNATMGVTGISAQVMLAWVKLAMIVSGLVLGIGALAAIPKRGWRGLLVEGILGIALSGGLLALVLWAAGDPRSRSVTERLVGDWKETSGPAAGRGSLHLSADGTGSWVMSGPLNTATLSGKWKVLRQQDETRPLVLRLAFDKAPEFAPELKGMAWEIEHTESGRLDLSTRDQDGKNVMEIFVRENK